MLEDLCASVSEQSKSDTQLPDQSTVDQQQPDRPEQSKQSLPKHLPHETLIHELKLRCECCGEAHKVIVQDCSDQFEYEPSSFRVIKHMRPHISLWL